MLSKRDKAYNKKNLIAVVALGVALASFVWQINSAVRPSLDIAVMSSISLLDMTKDQEPEIEVFVAGQSVTNITKMEILIVNNGNVCFEMEDFAEPVRFTVSPGANLIAARVEDRLPASLHGELMINLESGTVIWKPELFNPRDELLISLYFSAPNVLLPSVVARIRGVSDIQLKDRQTSTDGSKGQIGLWKMILYSLGWSFGVLCLLLSLVGFVSVKAERRVRENLHVLQREILNHDTDSLKVYIRQSEVLKGLGQTFVNKLVTTVADATSIEEARLVVLGMVKKKASGPSKTVAWVFFCAGVLSLGKLLGVW